MTLRGLIARLVQDERGFPKGITFPVERATQLIEQHYAQSWFVYALTGRAERWHVWAPSRWLALRISTRARILETACGCGWNLIWFGQQGFRELTGFDNDDKALAAGNALCAEAGVSAHLFLDDGLNPRHVPAPGYDVILAFSWTYCVDVFDLQAFVARYAAHLRPGGYLAMDAIDAAYNHSPNNQYFTIDWGLPVDRRRPTEYPWRWTFDQVRTAAESAGLVIAKHDIQGGDVPRAFYVLQRPVGQRPARTGSS